MLHFQSFRLAALATSAMVSMGLAGCAAMSANPENIMKIHQGMASEKILEMFGTPDKVSQAVCGGAVGKTWNCTTWKYGSWASFTFAEGRGSSLVLNDYYIERQF